MRIKQKIWMLFLLFTLLSTSFQSCVKYNEVGYNSLYYYLNGEEFDEIVCKGIDIIPDVYYSQANQQLDISFCVNLTKDKQERLQKNVRMQVQINNYQGPGIYYFDANSGNVWKMDTLQSDVSNKDTYIKILEFDGEAVGVLSATFEAHFKDTSAIKYDFTEGRLFVHYLNLD